MVLISHRPAGSAIHRVKRGETLSAIGRRYGVDTTELAERNGIRNHNALRSGATLVLPDGALPRGPMPHCPVVGASRFDIAQNFGAPRAGGRHAGNDIFARRGTRVVAPSDGVLRRADGGRAGKAFYIERADGVILYGAHLDSISARPGPVRRGQVIGTVGTTGNARFTPPHLHFEVHQRRGKTIDPQALLRAWCG